MSPIKGGKSMKWFLVVVAVLAFLFGIMVFAGAQSAIHETEAGVAFVIFTVAMSSAGVIEAVQAVKNEIFQLRKDIADHAERARVVSRPGL
jgi:protein-S-isoprenylcysteine O-methyltransferase Ste14